VRSEARITKNGAALPRVATWQRRARVAGVFPGVLRPVAAKDSVNCTAVGAHDNGATAKYSFVISIR
jgi:hypothetical protein